MLRVRLDVRGDLTLNSMAQIHPSVTLLTSHDLAWNSGRVTYQLFPEMEEMHIEKVPQRTFW